MPVGLAESDFQEPSAPPLLQEVANKLPLKKKQADLVLRELLELGERYGTEAQSIGKLLSSPPKDNREFHDLEHFAKIGTTPKTPTLSAPTMSAIEAQKLLLLAFSLEKSILEINSLESAIAEKDLALTALLQEGSEHPVKLTAPSMPSSQNDSSSNELVVGLPWQRIFDAMLFFCPESTLFFSYDPSVHTVVQRLGCTTDFSEHFENILSFPFPSSCSFCYYEGPAWAIFNTSGAAVDKPWRDKSISVLSVYLQDNFSK